MTVQHERLMYALMLRQINATSEPLRDAYQRLEAALAAAMTKLPRTVILDWVEAEITLLQQPDCTHADIGPILLKEAVSLGNLARG